jgi:AraC-like DNA-binding protein/ligand-binding sensor protein
MNAHTSAQPAPAASAGADSIRRNQELVTRIEKSQIFRNYRSAFETATGLPLVLRGAGSFQPPLAGSKQMNPFCALMAARSKACAACLDLQQRAEVEAGGESTTLECFAGLFDSVVPVRLGETIVAYLQTGQVMFRAPSERKFRAAVKQLEQWNAVGNVVELQAAYFQTRVLARPNYEATVRLLGSFAEHLSLLSNELMIKEAAAEPGAVSKARAFIMEHLGEALSLGEVARAAAMSPFYFCKIFKEAIGVTFTDYVARMRVEKTKQMLLNPNVRVSEAAFAAGFQSLSQFNRVFRRITGQSPTNYRDHLHNTTSRSALAFAA